jgi:uncharacterized protein
MPRVIRITAGSVTQLAELNESVTASQIWDALPLQARASTWGDEIYFRIPVSAEYEDAQDIVEFGDIAYWPPGSAFCIFFGRTPASTGNEIRPASAVNVFGKLLGDPKAFKPVGDGDRVLIEEVEDE